MHKKKRRMQIRHRKLRRRKNVSFKELSAKEFGLVKEQAEWVSKGVFGIDTRSLSQIRDKNKVPFKSIFENLRQRFPDQVLDVLCEGIGRSSLKEDLLRSTANLGKLNVVTTDIRAGEGWPDVHSNVFDLSRTFKRKRFHIVISAFGGPTISPMPEIFGHSKTPLLEKAFFQVASVLEPGGVGVLLVGKNYLEGKLPSLAKRLNLSIKINKSIQWEGRTIIFTKNIGRRKRK